MGPGRPSISRGRKVYGARQRAMEVAVPVAPEKPQAQPSWAKGGEGSGNELRRLAVKELSKHPPPRTSVEAGQETRDVLEAELSCSTTSKPATWGVSIQVAWAVKRPPEIALEETEPALLSEHRRGDGKTRANEIVGKGVVGAAAADGGLPRRADRKDPNTGVKTLRHGFELSIPGETSGAKGWALRRAGHRPLNLSVARAAGIVDTGRKGGKVRSQGIMDTEKPFETESLEGRHACIELSLEAVLQTSATNPPGSGGTRDEGSPAVRESCLDDAGIELTATGNLESIRRGR